MAGELTPIMDEYERLNQVLMMTPFNEFTPIHRG
jgi:hypothetical protein